MFLAKTQISLGGWHFLNTYGRPIRLGGCPGWSESSLGTQIILLCFFMLQLNGIIISVHYICATWWENMFYAICEQQRRRWAAHPRHLISVFVVHYLDSIIPILAKSNISRLQLVSVAGQAVLSLAWLKTCKDRFFFVVWLICSLFHYYSNCLPQFILCLEFLLIFYQFISLLVVFFFGWKC